MSFFASLASFLFKALFEIAITTPRKTYETKSINGQIRIHTSTDRALDKYSNL